MAINICLGKSRVAINTMTQFLEQNKDNRAIYISLSQNNVLKSFESFNPELKSRAAFFTLGGDESKISDAEFILLPK